MPAVNELGTYEKEQIFFLYLVVILHHVSFQKVLPAHYSLALKVSRLIKLVEHEKKRVMPMPT